ncbi:MAG: 50S ribosomal protein L4 [Candidatus Omnitrophota bacterium]|nr:50S ribosomal protein L4 [Candidatus Omnitrophota bacterium]
MSKLAIYNSKGKETGHMAIDTAFTREKVNTKVLYQAVNSYLSSRHRGTHKTKKRDEVRGGGKKPWRQKGTGRARTGSIRNPLWRGGGIIFGPVVRNCSHAVSRKTKRLALSEAIKSKIQNKNIIIFDNVFLEKPKTKDNSIIKSLKLGSKCLMVLENVEKNVWLASRNIAGFKILRRRNMTALDVLTYNKLAVSKESFVNLLKGNE